MARIPLIDHHAPGVDPKAAKFLSAIESSRSGRPVLNVHRALANHPELMEAFNSFASAAYLRNSLNPRQRELPYLTSAVAISCFY